MKGNTETARKAAREMCKLDEPRNRDSLKREMVNESIYHVIVEGGFHSQQLDDHEVDFLSRQLTIGGITQLEEYAKGEIA